VGIKMERYDRITGFADEIAQDLSTQIESFGKLGIRYIEMRGVDGKNLIHHDNAKVTEIKKRLDDAGIRLSALGSPLGKIGMDDHFEPHFEEFKRACEIAHMMDTPCIRMFSFYPPHDKDAVFERLGRFAGYAKENDVCLLHENEKDIYGEKAKECKEIMDEFGGEHFKAIFDFANFVQAGQDTLEAYEVLKDHIAYIHVKDAIAGSGKVVPAGYGDGNVKEILKRLFSDGFKGFLSLEPHLFDFDGFAGLEKGDMKLPSFEEGKKLNGFEAFSLAYDSLVRIIE
jgi:sugar phosphate isomerase/epimerase